MKKNIPVIKNQQYVLNIDSSGYEGEGIGKVQDFTVFVPGAMPGEEVTAKIVKVNKNFAFGKLLKVITPSKNRVEPICSLYKKCGGCQLQHFSYEAQLEFKKQRVKDCLERIGKLSVKLYEDNLNYDKDIMNKDNTVILYDTIGMENPYNYRNKVQLPVGKEKGEVSIGFYAKRSHQIINMNTCAIQNKESDLILKIIKDWMNGYEIEPYDERSGTGNVRHVMIRKGFKTNEIMVVIVTNSREFPHKDELVETLINEIKSVKSIVQNINMKKTNVILGQECRTIWGNDYISDYIGDFKFNISPLSFFQVNPVQTKMLYDTALKYANLTGSEIVFDAYCGTGTISLFLSKMARKVYGVEIIPEAIYNARINAVQNGVKNVEFIVGESEKVIPDLVNRGVNADVVVVDPPRKGCDRKLLDTIAIMKPKTVVYVSCDPSTLARDLNILGASGYKAVKVQPVDMFPQTAHVETVVKLIKQNQ